MRMTWRDPLCPSPSIKMIRHWKHLHHSIWHLLAAFSVDIFIPVLSGYTLFYLDQFYHIPWVMTWYKLTRLTRKHTGKIDADCDTGSGETLDNDRIMPRVRVTKVAPGDIIERQFVKQNPRPVYVAVTWAQRNFSHRVSLHLLSATRSQIFTRRR